MLSFLPKTILSLIDVSVDLSDQKNAVCKSELLNTMITRGVP